MKDFFKVKFTVSPKENQIPGYYNELLISIRKWIEKKYEKSVVQAIIPSWDGFANGGSFGDEEKIEYFYAESISDCIDGVSPVCAWACRIIERQKGGSKYVDRDWITEIGYRKLSERDAEISYYVGYKDLWGGEGHLSVKPTFNVPKVARFLLSSEKWSCKSNNKIIEADKDHYEAYNGDLFGVDACRELVKEKRKKLGISDNKRWISLCKVNRPDRNNDIWMLRLADCVDGLLMSPKFDDGKEQIFDNRRLIYFTDGPAVPESIGFWEWTECKSESGKWKTDAYFIEQETPIEIILLENTSTIDDVVRSLMDGVKLPNYLRGRLMFVAKIEGTIQGVLCERDDFIIRPGSSTNFILKEEIHSLPSYEFSVTDIFTWKDRLIFKRINPGELKRNIPVSSIEDTIKQLILLHMNWPVFKAQGISKNDWRKFRAFIDSIPKESIISSLTKTYDVPCEEAQSWLESFLQKADTFIEAKDVDAETIVQMVENHEGLRKVCDIAAEKRWQETNAERIAEAERELDAIRKDITIAQKTKAQILSETDATQEKLNQLLAEIKKNEILGRDTIAAVRKKIADAQKDMGSFIAELSVFLPDTVPSPRHESAWKYKPSTEMVSDGEEFEIADSWMNEYDAIFQNLSSVLQVDSELCSMLTAFLYSAYINNVPVLVAGPCGVEVAEIFSVSMFGRGAGELVIGNEYDNCIVDDLQKRTEEIITISNMFGKGWADTFPQSFCRLKKQVVWTHPYTEDLLIEPKGLFNYMLPIFSENFVTALELNNLVPGKRADQFVPFVSKGSKRLQISAIRKLGLSKMLITRMERVLSDAKTILNSPAKEKDIEMLFGLLPISVLSGRTDVLREAIDSETGISNSVKAEVARYLTEE